jgi:hypothetical protein
MVSHLPRYSSWVPGEHSIKEGMYPMRTPVKTVSKPYIYSADITIAANAIGQIPFVVNADYDFHCSAFSFIAETNNANIIPYFSIQILANDDRIMFDWTRARLFAGQMVELSTAPDTLYPIGLANWFRFDCPYIFPARSNIVINLRNDVAVQNVIHFALNGKRVYTLYS